MWEKLFGSKKKPIDDYVFDDEPKTLDKGKQSLQDMSLIAAQYNDFLVTKRGYLVVLLKVTGINLDLLTTTEQEDVFDEFNAFLMSTLGENSEEVQQYLDITMPVDFSDYILFWQHRYLTVLEEEPENEAKLALIASYVDTFSGVASSQEMTTKTHIVVLHEKIPKKHLASLEQTAIHLEEKVLLFIRQLENALSTYDVEARQLTAKECRKVLQHLLNFSNH
ncbi:TrsD/TraD family conjugative transfer protein [Lysinibacillus sp. K60]|uniref:TrsD/TraD family conjugative transfer protein n=1 Tax=Lysinibacillus TaxID=400634 RepID=UPI001C8B8131|nr:TrsD/TraD family conjugative transfer protein [Lysinibacillus sp. K60]MBX8946833.1 conjugal transfer protein [Lysinibacillus sp. K60]